MRRLPERTIRIGRALENDLVVDDLSVSRTHAELRRRADGHYEIKKWLSWTSKYPVLFYYPNQRTFDALGRADFAWYLERTGFVDRTGHPAFGY